MELVLPNNYVEIQDEEMMYLDGGWEFTGVYNDVVAFAGNTLFNALCGGGTISIIRKILSSNSIKQGIIKYTKKWLSVRAANTLAGRVIGILFGYSSWSIGGFVAQWWDNHDTNPGNGICGASNW